MQKKTFGIIVALGMLIMSCNKNDLNSLSDQNQDLHKIAMSDTMNLASMTIDDKRIFLESILMDLGKYIATEAQVNSDARNIIYSELEENVDRDDNAIVELFYEDIGLNNNAKFINCLANFNDLEGHKYFPQIFIYNYENLKIGGQIGVSNDILAVFYTGNESETSAKAYKLNPSGIWEYEKMVDEQTISNEEVWVFSLNETFEDVIDLSILPPLDMDPPEQEKPTGSEEYCVNGEKHWPYFEYMQIRKHNESWLAGKSDVWAVTYTGWDTPNRINPCDPTQPPFYWINNPYGELFVHKYMRYLVGTNQKIVRGYAGNWRPGPYNTGGWQGDAFNYVIYEKDQWPTGKKETQIDNNGNIAYYDYRSADSYYDQGIILFWSATEPHMQGYSRDISGQIKFNSRL